MAEDRSTDETVVLAAYSSRHDAELARDLLGDHGIRAFVAADDVHPPLQVTEGSRLLVMARDAVEGYNLLEEAAMLPESDGSSRATESDQQGTRPISFTAWLFITAFVLVLVLLAVGSLM